ncbi:AMP-binding protein [Alcanivorax sp. JB21]|uniref:class I adenylate-forming enzyme family protein n=1 Tax=Alcanivorax limicola TaxID=2874102 RepID=UPI001CBD372A|nr:AMP-binding protein [Alcanivorax limicola]MBZ2187531.1 AMP-binding protein [Alcanivorax limicola]
MNSLITEMPVHAAAVDTVFQSLPDRLRQLTAEAPDAPAVIDDTGRWTRAELQSRAYRIAHRLIACGLQRGDTVAVLGANSRDYVALLVGTLAAGGCFVPLSGMATGDSLALMIDDCDTRFVFCDPQYADTLPPLAGVPAAHHLLLQGQLDGWQALEDWLGDAPDHAPDITLHEDDAFNIIYSSGTTGRPKGIVHDHRLRAHQHDRFVRMGFGPGCVTLLATPIYSNTTMVGLLPTLKSGGLLILMSKFDATGYLALAEQHAVTHTIMIPVQYQRLLAEPAFEHTDLSHFQLKMSSGAPLRAPLIKQLVARWPGTLLELYGMTEGGGSTVLNCNAFPDKWDSVGKAGEGTQLHVIDEQGRVLPPNTAGELVGRGSIMMRGYYKRPEQTQEMLWHDEQGQVFYRTGDMARIDEDGFVYLLDRRKDMILSGGFNIFAEDLEKVLSSHEQVEDVAVIAVPSEAWGETPLGIVVRRPGADIDAETLRHWVNERLGKTQRLSAIEFHDSLPRNPLGKIMKRELRAPYWPQQ